MEWSPKNGWIGVPGYENAYEINMATHQVRSVDRYVIHGKGGYALRKGKILAKRMSHNGYTTFMANVDKKSTVVFIHKVIAKFFYGDRPVGEVCRHLDCNKTNNSHTNLAYGRPSENSRDELRVHGFGKLSQRASKAIASKGQTQSEHRYSKIPEHHRLSAEEFYEIKRLYATGVHSKKYIGALFGVSTSAVHNVLKKDFPKKPAHLIYQSEKERIMTLYNTGKYSQKEIAGMVGRTRHDVSKVVQTTFIRQEGK